MKQRHVIKAYCYDKRGRLISSAENNYFKSHPLQAHFAKKVGHHHRIYLHAEIAAILKAREKPIFKIKIERYGKHSTLLPSKPCPICMEAIKTFNIANVEYTV